MILDPRVVERGVIGDEVEHQPQIPFAQALAQARERNVATETGMYRIGGDREARSCDVVLRKIGQGVLELLAPLAIGARYLLPRQSGRPDAQQPDPIESNIGNPVELLVRNVVQSDCAPKIAGEL